MQPVYHINDNYKQQLLDLTDQMIKLKRENDIIPVPDGLLHKMQIKYSQGLVNLAQINLAFEFLHSCIDCTRSFAKTEHYEACYKFSCLALSYLRILNNIYLENNQVEETHNVF